MSFLSCMTMSRIPHCFLIAMLLAGWCYGASATPAGTASAAQRMSLTLPALRQGALPKAYLYENENRSPQLTWTKVPPGVQSFVVLMDDPDARAVMGKTYAHWLVVDIPASATGLPASPSSPNGVAVQYPPPRVALPGSATVGVTTGGEFGYEGPAPPPGTTHTYRVRVYAMRAKTTTIDRNRTWTVEEFESSFAGQILAIGDTTFRAGAASP